MIKRDKTLQVQLQRLIDMKSFNRLEPEQRLALAVLRQAVFDYFGDKPELKQSAADYFAASPLYHLTLRMFKLPPDLLPIGVDLGRAPDEDTTEPVDPLKLETLVHELSGTQLKVMLTLGLLELPATAGQIGLQCRLNRGTVLSALAKLAEQGLVTTVDNGLYTIWTVPNLAQQFLDELWEAAGRDVMPELQPEEQDSPPAPASGADLTAE